MFPPVFLKNVKNIEARVGQEVFEQHYVPSMKLLWENAGISTTMLDHFAKHWPWLLDSRSKANKTPLKDMLDILERQGVPKGETRLIFFSIRNILSFDEKFFEDRKLFLSSFFGFSPEEIKKILIHMPLVFFTPEESMKSTYKVLNIALDEKENLVNAIIKKHPYILVVPLQRLRENMYHFYDYGIKPQQLYNILYGFCHFLFKRKGNLVSLLGVFKRMGLTNEQILTMLQTNPFILSMDCGLMLIPKIKLLHKNGVKKGKTLRDMLIKNPWVITKSISSLTAKFAYLSRKHNQIVVMMNDFPRILIYNYDSFIKPRGELMLQHNKYFWGEVIDMTDQQVADKVGVPVQELERLKPAKQQPEIDFDWLRIDRYFSRELKSEIYSHPYL